MGDRRVLETLGFYTAIGRAISPLELWRALPPPDRPWSLDILLQTIKKLKKAEIIAEDSGLLALHGLGEKHPASSRGEQDEFLKLKKKEFLHSRQIFNWIPFLDFVLLAGSLALGSVKKSSDFDFMVGCKSKRVFTARFFTLGFSRILGKRPNFCFSLFAAPEGYLMPPPHTRSWTMLFQKLVPVYGSEEATTAFFKTNNWATREPVVFDSMWLPRHRNFLRSLIELVLLSWVGDLMESTLAMIQKKTIGIFVKNKNAGNEERLDISSRRIECHMKEPHFQKIEREVARAVLKSLGKY